MHIPAISNPKRLLCIDPGPVRSGVVTYHERGMRVLYHDASIKNEDLLDLILQLKNEIDLQVLEMIGHYGMAVGRDIFETVRWIGIFQYAFGMDITVLHLRRDVKLELCNNPNANDSNIRTSILGRFPQAGGGKTPAIGTKKIPGPLYGIKSHSMSAVALAVSWRNNFESEPPWKRIR